MRSRVLLLTFLSLISLVSMAFEGVSFDLSEKKFDAPIREVSVIISDEGYYPKQIQVFTGEKIKLFVTTITKKPSCLMLSGKKLFMGTHKGDMAEGSVSFDTPGEYEYYCPTGRIKGKITVLERAEIKKERLRREIASQKDQVMQWRPKDEL